ncbi:hypothetical protein ARMSODRAFT_375060 [Armillaria solidipes]|uniref:Uncharacterized protein n=1 Tax=Armillaria solidipes TaxID=1076256 RepID=A0A2H3BFL2_9AGAR|nr:hypothetical protein ARMSODRAFT_375060 [Armillaria solidipes]
MPHGPVSKIHHLPRLHPSAYSFHYLLRRPPKTSKGKSGKRGVSIPHCATQHSWFPSSVQTCSLYIFPARLDWSWLGSTFRVTGTIAPWHLDRKTRMHIYFSMIDPGNSMVSWDFTFKKLIQVGVPAHCFGGIIDPGPFEMLVKDGVRYLRQPTYIYETQLGIWDSRNINRRLWVASKGRHRLSCLASLFYRREFKRVQSSLLASCSISRMRISSGWPTLLESVV